MRYWLSLLSAVGGIALSRADQTPFEPADFDVTAALKDKGVDVSRIPALDGFAIESTDNPCSAAVSLQLEHANIN